MAQIREIKRRIRSITNTSKVTHAMELVAAAKMKKSQEKALASRPYTNTLHEIISELRPKSHRKTHRLLLTPKADTQLVIILTSDRGLVGGLNLNIFRQVLKDLAPKQPGSQKTKFVTVGKKARTFAAKSGFEVTASFGSEDQPFLDLARTLTKISVDSFVAEEINSVYLVYPHFESTIKQQATTLKLLPLDLKEELPSSTEVAGLPTDILFEPTADEILESILPHLVLTRVYQALLEAKASEHSARMVAMKNATDAASDLVDDLTLAYNQARQEAITKEILDMVTAQSALG